MRRATGFDCLAMVKPQFEVGRERVGKGGVVRDAELRREVDRRVARRRGAGRAVLGRRRRAAGPEGNLETFLWLAEGARAGLVDDEAAAGRAVTGASSPTAARARRRTRSRTLIGRRAAPACELRFDPEEAEKHGIEAGAGHRGRRRVGDDVDLCVVLGGDGTILSALRRYAGHRRAVFAVNFGEVGFLATIDPDGFEEGFARRSPASSRCSSCPTISLGRPDGT